ncbi:hypothetical protein ACFL3H_07910 [Gemmatimonadota bacterium]
MHRQSIHHILAIVFALPVLGIAIACAIDSPYLLNPWNNYDAVFNFGALWFLVLPQLLCSLAVVINAIIGLKAARKLE